MNRAFTITSLNRKGGVGKTHLCWLIASLCEHHGQRCLIVDLDPQANFTSSFLDDAGALKTVERLFDPARELPASELIQATRYAGIDVLPSSPKLESYNATDPKDWQSEDLQLSLSDAINPLTDQYDFILFDCPPSLSLVSYAALSASSFVMIPLEAARWGALGTQHIISAIDYVQCNFNKNLRLLGYVVSRFKHRRAYQQTYLQELREHFGEDAFETVIPDLASFEKSVTDRISITLHSPSSHASKIASEFFDELTSRCRQRHT